MASKCKFFTQNGKPCGADPQSGKDVCVFHDPSHACDGLRARRAGGLNRTRVAVLGPDTPDHELRNTHDVSVLLADSINRVRRGELDAKVANGIGFLATVLLRSLTQERIEQQLADLERVMGKSQTATALFEFRSKTKDGE